jgi:hypothetical protein
VSRMRRLFPVAAALTLCLYPLGLTAQMRRPYPPPYGRYPFVPEADLRIDVTPKEAEVYVDGYFAGKVDDFDGVFQRLHVTPGEHEIVIFLDGFRARREKLYVGVNTTRKIEGELARLQPGEAPEQRPEPTSEAPPAGAPPFDRNDPRYPAPRGPERLPPASSRSGSLVFRVQPADAEVFIDGERWRGPSGDNRLVVQVPGGRHRIEIRKEGFRTFEEDVEVDAGESLPINVSLSAQ